MLDSEKAKACLDTVMAGGEVSVPGGTMALVNDAIRIYIWSSASGASQEGTVSQTEALSVLMTWVKLDYVRREK